MHRSIMTALVPIVLAATLIGVGGLTALDLDTPPARYPTFGQDLSQHIDLGFLSQGIIREYGAYYVEDQPVTVAGWFRRRYHVQPEPGARQMDACIRLVKADHYRIARLTLVVSLCPSGHGTTISFSHTLTLVH